MLPIFYPNLVSDKLTTSCIAATRSNIACRFKVAALSGNTAWAFSLSGIAPELNRIQLSVVCCFGQSSKVNWLARWCLLLGLFSSYIVSSINQTSYLKVSFHLIIINVSGIEVRKLDVTSKEEIAALASDVDKIDVLFNCAGWVQSWAREEIHSWTSVYCV